MGPLRFPWLRSHTASLDDMTTGLPLQVTEKGLTAEQHRQRLEEYGPNKLPEGTRNPILVYLGCGHSEVTELLLWLTSSTNCAIRRIAY